MAVEKSPRFFKESVNIIKIGNSEMNHKADEIGTSSIIIGIGPYFFPGNLLRGTFSLSRNCSDDFDRDD